jgi:hypothetical protein
MEVFTAVERSMISLRLPERLTIAVLKNRLAIKRLGIVGNQRAGSPLPLILRPLTEASE